VVASYPARGDPHESKDFIVPSNRRENGATKYSAKLGHEALKTPINHHGNTKSAVS